MKKSIIILISIFFTLSSSISAFAAGWVQDEKGWRYQNTYGTYKSNEWFKEDGYTYHFDTFGYMQHSDYVEIYGEYYYFDDDGRLCQNMCFPEPGFAHTNKGDIHFSDESGLLIGQITQYNAEMNAIEVKICNMRNVPIVLQGTAEVSGSGINEEWYVINDTANNIKGNPITIQPLTTVSYYFGPLLSHALNFKDFDFNLKCHYTCEGNDTYWVSTNVQAPTDYWYVAYIP